MVVRRQVKMPKIMDITHPSDVRPSTTSRPVIITNRPMITEDPMIAQAAEAAADIEKPAGAAPVISNKEKTEVTYQVKDIQPLSLETEDVTEENTVDDKKSEPESRLKLEQESDDQANGAKPAQSEVENTSEQQTIIEPDLEENEKTEDVVEDEHVAQAETVDDGTNTDSVADAGYVPEDGSTQLDQGNPETKEEFAEDVRRQEIDSIIAKGTYFIPINSARKRMGRIIFWLIFILLLSLVVFDLSLDMGLLSLSSLPHTTFFK